MEPHSSMRTTRQLINACMHISACMHALAAHVHVHACMRTTRLLISEAEMRSLYMEHHIDGGQGIHGSYAQALWAFT